MMKRDFNRIVMVKLLSNLTLLVNPTALEKHRQQWSVFIVGSVSGKAEDAGQAALHSLSHADRLCIVEVMAAARRTRAITSETH